MSSTKRRTKYYGDSEPKIWPADHPRVSRAPAKKDTRRWCRGKVGVEHFPVIVKRTGWYGLRGCERVTEEWALKLWPGRTWRCSHREECANCGKVVRHSINLVECPAYIPED